MRTAALLAFALLAMACPARAHAITYPGQHPAPPVILDLVSAADGFWTERSVVGNCLTTPTVWEAPSLLAGDGDAWGRGDGAACEIWLSDYLVGTIQQALVFDDVVHACQAITHEDGHARGLGHAPSGIMAGTGPWGQPDAAPPGLRWAPAFCIRFARSALRSSMRRDGVPARTRDHFMRSIAIEIRGWGRAELASRS
jgi:hypothetical protein